MYRYTNSVYYNSEGYYDPTAGKVFAQIVREEKAKHKPVKRVSIIKSADNVIHYSDPVLDFAQWYAVEYTRTHGLRTSKHAVGKPKVWGDPKRIKKHINFYLYCIDHCDDEDFCIDTAAVACHLSYERAQRVARQIFSGTHGNTTTLINAWYYWNENIREVS